jgi:glycosyltransferase involved in cell wall biosynthesis
MDEPLVSVITVFFNAERFFQEAIDSVLAQTYRNWELLLVDDGSTDGSTRIAQSTGHPAVRYLDHPRHENRGVGASRNLGLTHARGDYLVCLDADDVFFPETLHRQVAILSANPHAAAAYGSTEFWLSWRTDPQRPDWCDEAGSRVPCPNSLIDPPKLPTLYLRDREAVPCWHAIAFRTEAIREVGGFDESSRLNLYEDQVVHAKVFLEKPVFVTDAILGRYRQHEDQRCVRTDRETKDSDRAGFLRWLSLYIDERGFDDAELRSALSDALAETTANSVKPPGRASRMLRPLRAFARAR